MVLDSRVERKDFDKLKQLDKIELLLKLDRIEKKKDYSYFDCAHITTLLCFFMAYILLCILINKKLIILLELIPKIISLAIIIIVIGSIYNSINKSKYKKELYELKNEFFVQGVKKR